jgi:hypothetical protein
MNGCTNAFCHGGGFPAGDSRNFTNQTQAYNFAIARSSNNNANSLFLTKPSQTNGQIHGGGTAWPSGGSSYNTALAWINSGRTM